jgi:polyisoprenoid-binding protein YceI
MKHINICSLVAGVSAFVLTTNAAPLEINPQQSKVEVAVSCTIDSFVAHLDKYQATVDCDPAVPLPAKADVSFNFTDLKTGNPDRDAAMLKWLEYDAHPTASFHLTGWQQSGTTNIALGQLTIHGIAVAVQMPAIVKQDANGWDISGQTSFDYRDFKLTKIRKALFLTVDPLLTVKFHLAGKAVAAK